MPSCVIKVCRNYKGRLATTQKVSYYRIPIDPIMRSRWVNLIRRSRGEDLWQPAKTTIICSDHFNENDTYFLPNQKRRRLKKGALPTKALFLSSLETDDSEISDEDRLPRKEFFTMPELSCESENTDKNKELSVKESLASAEDSAASDFTRDPQPSTSAKNDEGNKEDFSDLDSVFDTPKKAKLRKELRRKIIIQKKHTQRIQSLRRKNLRLKKKMASFKHLLKILKKERYVDMDTHNALSSNVFAADLYASMKKKMKGKSKKPISKYAPEFRKFCLTLHFLSPQAYSYVRKKFETCLPHPKTISKWYANIDGSPGLTAEAFDPQLLRC